MGAIFASYNRIIVVISNIFIHKSERESFTNVQMNTKICSVFRERSAKIWTFGRLPSPPMVSRVFKDYQGFPMIAQ